MQSQVVGTIEVEGDASVADLHPQAELPRGRPSCCPRQPPLSKVRAYTIVQADLEQLSNQLKQEYHKLTRNPG